MNARIFWTNASATKDGKEMDLGSVAAAIIAVATTAGAAKIAQNVGSHNVRPGGDPVGDATAAAHERAPHGTRPNGDAGRGAGNQNVGRRSRGVGAERSVDW